MNKAAARFAQRVATKAAGAFGPMFLGGKKWTAPKRKKKKAQKRRCRRISEQGKAAEAVDVALKSLVSSDRHRKMASELFGKNLDQLTAQEIKTLSRLGKFEFDFSGSGTAGQGPAPNANPS